jgi:hypothetical protein
VDSAGVAIGAPGWPSSAHGVYSFNRLDPLPTGYALAAPGEVPQFGWLLRSAGDVDGDGCDEAITSNYPEGDGALVWILKCAPLGISERIAAPCGRHGLEIRQIAPTGNADAEFEASGVKGGKLDVQVYDLTGRRAGNAVVEMTCGGRARITWHGQAFGRAWLPCGIYWVRASQVGSTAVRKFAMAK